MRRLRRHGLVWEVVVASAAVVAACVAAPSPPDLPSLTSPAPSKTDSASPSAATPAPLPSAIAYAIRQREQFGLRADREWVEAVAHDPSARVFLLDIPLLPAEEATLDARQAAYDAVIAAVRTHAAAVPDEFGGVYIDNANATIVALWTARTEAHRLAVLDVLGRVGPLESRLVTNTERDLEALQARISADWEWVKSVRAAPLGVGVDIMANVVDMEISSTNEDAPAQILAHYGVGADVLRITSDGTGVALMPRGWVDGTVVTAEGRAPGTTGLMIGWVPDRAGECGGGDIGYGVAAEGSFRLPCTAGGWTITVQAPVPDDGWLEVGHAHVEVPPNGTATVRISLERGANLDS